MDERTVFVVLEKDQCTVPIPAELECFRCYLKAGNLFIPLEPQEGIGWDMPSVRHHLKFKVADLAGIALTIVSQHPWRNPFEPSPHRKYQHYKRQKAAAASRQPTGPESAGS